jgi:hypothetical protein
MEKHTKKVNLSLDGVNGNAFAIMGVFRRQAKREGWSKEEIDQVLNEATSGDYENLVATILSYCDPQDEHYG